VDDGLYPLLRFAQYGLMLGLFGLMAFAMFGLRQSLPARPNAKSASALIISAWLAPVVSTAVMLASIGVMMAQPFWQLEWTTVHAILTGTDLGSAFFVRVAALIVAATLLTFSRTSAGRWLAISCFGISLATLAWSGHAAATEGAIGLVHRLNDAVHLLAAGLWLGAIGWFLALVLAAHRQKDGTPSVGLIADMHHFAPLGAFLVIAVSITGLVNAHLTFGLSNVGTVIGTDYGILLAAKIALVAVMVGFGARHAVVGRRLYQSGHHDARPTLAHLRFTLAAELTVAVTVTALIAMVGTLSPMTE
jgi:putative copper resistance protein D